jgi:hypothetical protein
MYFHFPACRRALGEWSATRCLWLREGSPALAECIGDSASIEPPTSSRTDNCTSQRQFGPMIQKSFRSSSAMSPPTEAIPSPGICAPQPKRMPTLRIQIHLHRNPGLLQCSIITQRLLHTVHVVILILQQERRRRLAGDMAINIRIQPETVIGERQTPRIDSYRKIRAAAFFSTASTAGYKRCSNACSSLPTCGRLPKTQARQSCADRYATLRHGNGPSPRPWASSKAFGESGYVPDFDKFRSPGTRYFNNTHVMPLDVSQSHTSVPSR